GAGRVVEVMALLRQQLTGAPERGPEAVPYAHEGTREVPAPDVLRVERHQPVAAGQRQVGHVQRQAGRDETQPQEVPARPVAGTPPPEVHQIWHAVLARPVEV